jgi:hypothetical protein
VPEGDTFVLGRLSRHDNGLIIIPAFDGLRFETADDCLKKLEVVTGEDAYGRMIGNVGRDGTPRLCRREHTSLAVTRTYGFGTPDDGSTMRHDRRAVPSTHRARSKRAAPVLLTVRDPGSVFAPTDALFYLVEGAPHNKSKYLLARKRAVRSRGRGSKTAIGWRK